MKLEIGSIVHDGVRSVAFLGLLAATLSVACEDADDIVAPGIGGTGGPEGVTLQVISGDGQTGTVDAPLSDLLVVEAVNDEGNPVVDVAIKWTPVAGSTFDSPQGTTGSDGRASASWRLGTTAGSYGATVATTGTGPSEVSFTAEALAGAPASIEIVSGDGQTGAVGTALPEALVVRVMDEFDNPVPDADLTWTPDAGSSFDVSDEATGEDGQASATWQLGTSAGDYSADVSASAGSVSFEAMATAGSATTLEIFSGDGQTAEVSTDLPSPLVVRSVDQYDNPVGGVNITWTPDAGSFATTEGVTGADGLAEATWTLGTVAGAHQADVSADAGGSVTFDATGTAAAAASIEIVSGDAQSGTVAQTLAQPLVVRISDQYDNDVANASISWTPAGGSSMASSATTTDADGLASADWQLGTVAGAYTVDVSSAPGSVSFDATAGADAPDYMVVVDGDNQVGVAGSEAADSLVVQVFDQYDNPVPNAGVNWSASHTGSAAAGSATTGPSGLATAAWTFGCPALMQTTTASNGSAGSVQFDGTAIPGPPAVIVNLTGDLQGLLGVLLFADLEARVEDACGNPLAGVDVDWTLTSVLGGSLLSPTTTTDINGVATNTLTLGVLLGDYTVLAEVGATLDVLFTATLLP